GAAETRARRHRPVQPAGLGRGRQHREDRGEAMRAPRSLRFSWLHVKVGVRMLARYPGLTLVGTAAIAVAIALGTLYFEALDKLMHPRFPIPTADRIVAIGTWDDSASTPEERTLHDFAFWRDQLKTVDQLGAAVVVQRNLATEDRRVE